VTGLVATQAFAQETANDEGQLKEAAPAPAVAAPAAQAAPAVEVVEPVAPVAARTRPKFGDVTTSGYFRGGFGMSSEKGRQVCFQLALNGGLLSKYRLGNECEVWAEMEFKTVVYAGDDGTYATLHFMPVAFIPTTRIGYSPTGVTSSDYGSYNTGATVAFPNLYADIKGISWLGGGTPWIGTRYYKRENIYISDFFYWNPSGVGAGIEDIGIGKAMPVPELSDMTLSYAAFAVDGEPTSNPQLPLQMGFGVREDLQLRGLYMYRHEDPVMRMIFGGEFQIGFQLITDRSASKDELGADLKSGTGGWGITIQHVSDGKRGSFILDPLGILAGFLGGDNKLAVQYGKGGGTGFGTLARFYYPDFSLTHGTAESRLRLVDVLTIQPFDWLGNQLAFVYEKDDLGTGQGAQTTWISAGDRVSVGIVDHLKVLGEVGYDRVKKTNGLADAQTLLKATGAVAIAGASGFWGRPELRLFYTWAMWNEAARGANIDSYSLYRYGNKLSGATAGVQAEAIW
jgi:maltoporin